MKTKKMLSRQQPKTGSSVLFLALVILCVLAVISCSVDDPPSIELEFETGTGTGTELEPEPEPAEPVVATPIADPPGGRVKENTQVTLTSRTPGTKIYYTLDGTKPDTTSTLYSENNKPKIAKNLTLKAAAVIETVDSADSGLISEIFEVKFLLPRTYQESVKRPEFKGETATITFGDLQQNETIYLGIINPTEKEVQAKDTGSVRGNFKSSAQRSLRSAAFTEQQPKMPAESVHPIKQQQSLSRAAAPIEPYIGLKKVDKFIQWGNPLPVGEYEVHTELKAIGRTNYLWIAYYQSYQSYENPRDPLIQEFLPDIGYEQAAELAANYDKMYDRLTNIYGCQNPVNRYGDQKVVVEVYQSHGDWAGYFSTGEPDTIYASSNLLSSTNNTNNILEVLSHESTHLLTHNIKSVYHGQREIPIWFYEMTAEASVILVSGHLGLSPTDLYHPMARLPNFIKGGYQQYSVTETYNNLTGFALYLMMNYGGIPLIKEIVTNAEVGFESITAALDKHQSGLTFNDAFAKVAEALIYSGPLTPVGAASFDKTIAATFNNIEYTIPGFDPWDGSYGPPKVFPLGQQDMPPYTVAIQSTSEWQNLSGSIAITLQKPTDPEIQLVLMVK